MTMSLRSLSAAAFMVVAVYASAEVTLKSGDRTWMLVSTTICMDTWALQI